MTETNTIKCPDCNSTNIEAKYTTCIMVNDMATDEDGGRYCESADHYMDGDFSEHLVCLECSNTFECDGWAS